jgi:Fanconi anemia group M protein
MFNDIFSKELSKPVKTEDNETCKNNWVGGRVTTKKDLPEITIDYREKNSFVPAELSALGHKIKLKELKVADYLVNEIAIERKTLSDFTQSMINRRLKKQLEEIKQYTKHLLLIETKTLIFENSIKGFILSILLNHKVPIIFTNSPKETANYISILSKQKPSKQKINPTKKQLSFYEQQKYILQSFPNIGQKKSEELLEKFKSLNNIFNAKEEELKLILGKKAKQFLNQLI